MSDAIKHECGIALIRLLKPLSFYIEKYKTPAYGLNKMYLLMEKQHNRGQDGAGLASIRLDMPLGSSYMARWRSLDQQPIKHIFNKVYNHYNQVVKQFPDIHKDEVLLKSKMPYAGELLLGHLRYGTFGKNKIHNCHPFLRQNNWMARNLVMAGNFNLTNVDRLFDQLVELGQHPKEKTDTITVMEKIGHFLDTEVQQIFDHYKDQGYSNRDITPHIVEELNIQNILKRSAKSFDGGFAIAGLIGHGDAFVLRDSNGIRPAYYYKDDEVVVVASERPAIQTTFNVQIDDIKEIEPGHALIVKKNGKVSMDRCLKEREKKSCSFERIYFSRGTDKDIYQERKKLGLLIAPKVLETINYDLENSVFSFIPNTAEISFYGMMEGMNNYINRRKVEKLKNKELTEDEIQEILSFKAKVEKVTVKDVKMRTFITEDASRDEMVSHVYDITYGSIIRDKDSLVVIDDSIVRGTTLQKSILSILDRLGPKKIVVVSSAPQIRYPDCYGIDMSQLNKFIAFRAMRALVKERNMENDFQELYKECKLAINEKSFKRVNYVKKAYDWFKPEEISQKISEIVKPDHIKAEVQIIYQSIENLHQACPNNLGDWYFTGNFPTKGGYKVVNKAFINYVEGIDERAY